jgi:NifU-like protein
VPVYPKQIADAIREPKFCRVVDAPNAIGVDAKFDCGCFVRVEMRIDAAHSTIGEIGFWTNGCGYMVAAAETIGSKLLGGSLLDLHGDIEINLSDRLACSEAVVRAVKNAFADHRSRLLEEFSGEKALICTCFGVTEETVEDFVRSARPNGVREVSEDLRAGSGCGSCRMLIQEIIDANA